MNGVNENGPVTILKKTQSTENGKKVEMTPKVVELKERPRIPKIPIEDMTSKDYYFDVYAYHKIHKRMLMDSVRTWAYRDAMFYNREKEIKGKIILDIGCGTGIMGMLAARCGAKRVIGIECSNIAQYAAMIVKANKLENIVTIIQGKVEDTELPDGITHVDAIVSEWMGNCLFSEGMVETIIYARDKWLKPGGTIFPDKCELFITSSDETALWKDRLLYWDKVYGFDMSCLGHARAQEPIVKRVFKNKVVTTTCSLKKFDLHSMKKEDVNFTSTFKLEAGRNDYIHCLVVYFTASFSKIERRFSISTSPYSDPTHWRQTLFFVPEPIAICEEEKLFGQFTLKQNSCYSRDLDVKIRLKMKGKVEDINSTTEYKMKLH